ncbi:pirin-like protein-like protein [Piptocephalis cylindrospora]|uniref:Pirin-like protein-like protein n=1 Tax=Piptocephalis cylindrospora TaxID=1907219 RepID=A0A4P9Y9G4_9FUNG|nr:pirin-like protein-like protein [Piptocephalis cylindrospora]|eukprot:RKP15061.1 pirin-like protein-like protein [Piptocephalis cylindrospora]
MSTSRTVVQSVLSVEQDEGVGARVRRSIGRPELRSCDPFLMLDEFDIGGKGGFPDHPHRGFETVTYVLEGESYHEDFAGHKGRLGPGDLQWMTAGRGIVHGEMPKPGVRSRGLQLWVNLPAKDKMCEPAYQELRDADVPRVQVPGGGGTVKVIAGESFGTSSPVSTRTPIMYLDAQIKPGTSLFHEIPSSYRGFIYVLTGTAKFGGTRSPAHTTLVLSDPKNEDGVTGVRVEVPEGEEMCHYVVVAGEPINEPIVQHGPFVMNTEEEIQRTMWDYQLKTNGFERAKGWKSSIRSMK